MIEMLALSRETAMLPEREVVKYIRSVMTLDGVVHRFAPDLELGHEIEQASIATLEAQSSRQLLFAAWAGALRAVESGRSLASRGLSGVAQPASAADPGQCDVAAAGRRGAGLRRVRRRWRPARCRPASISGRRNSPWGPIALLVLAIELVRQPNE